MPFNIGLEKSHCVKLPDSSIDHVFIKLQVRCDVITWYIQGESTQAFRDTLYTLAAASHRRMQKACDGYFRGSDSLHIKRMHTHFGESAVKHNHYRFLEGEVTPEILRNHLNGILAQEGGSDFLSEHEINEIVDKYSDCFRREHEQYKGRPGTQLMDFLYENQLTPHDKEEYEKNRHKEEPCKDPKRAVSFSLQALK